MKLNKVRSILIFFLSAITLLSALNSCLHKPEKDDSKEIAEEKNNKRFKTQASEKDAQFVVDVIANNMAELKIAALGEQQAKTTDVREIATMLKAQHGEILNKFKAYASLKQISIPTDLTPDAKQEELEVRDERDEKDFDKAWCRDVKEMHEKSLEKMEEESKSITDPELKDLAVETLPTVRLHYDKIMACAERLK